MTSASSTGEPPPADAPLSAEDLLRAAKFYLARRAASSHQLRAVLLRKIRRNAARQPERPDEAAVAALLDGVIERLGQAGWLDDPALAQSRAATFELKGLPATTIGRKLKTQGLVLPDAARDLLPVDDEAQALRYAERKRLGRFGSGRRAFSRDRDIRALVRAGFSPRLAMRVMDDLAPPPDPEPEAE